MTVYSRPIRSCYWTIRTANIKSSSRCVTGSTFLGVQTETFSPSSRTRINTGLPLRLSSSEFSFRSLLRSFSSSPVDDSLPNPVKNDSTLVPPVSVNDDVKAKGEKEESSSTDVSPLSSLKAPTETADQVIEALEHRLLQLPGEAIALSYDPSGVVRKHTIDLLKKCAHHQLSKFFDAQSSSFHLDAKSLNDFDFLVIARLSRFHAGKDQLRFLNLNNNLGGDLGADAIADHVVRHMKLRSLFLSGNHISDIGLKKLCEQMKTNRSIKLLELRKNQITDVGVEESLVPMLRANAGLTDLFLNKNNISDAGAVKLVTSLKEGRTVKIWLGDNDISDKTKGVLKEMAGDGVVRF